MAVWPLTFGYPIPWPGTLSGACPVTGSALPSEAINFSAFFPFFCARWNLIPQKRVSKETWGGVFLAAGPDSTVGILGRVQRSEGTDR